MDAEKYIRNRKRLNQATHQNLDEITQKLGNVLKAYNIDVMPETAFDVCCYVIESLYLERLNLPKC